MTTPGTRAAPYAPFTTVAANADLDTWLPASGRTTPNVPTYLANNAVSNVLDFAPVGIVINTGLVDVYSVFITALASGAPVVVPPGTYRLDTMLTLTSGQALYLQPGVTLIRKAAYSTATTPVIWVQGPKAVLVGAGQDCLIATENACPDGIVRNGHESSQLVGFGYTSHNVIDNFQLEGSQKSFPFGQTTGSPDIGMNVVGSAYSAVPYSYYHSISRLTIKYVNVPLYLNGQANANIIRDIIWYFVGDFDTSNAGLASYGIWLHGCTDNVISNGHASGGPNGYGLFLSDMNVAGGSMGLVRPYANTLTNLQCEQGGAGARPIVFDPASTAAQNYIQYTSICASASRIPAALMATNVILSPEFIALGSLFPNQQYTQALRFPSVQVPSADANTLDDYEEGTWTPVPNSLTVVGTPTYTGRYTKIGRLVHGALRVQSTTSTASTANVTTFSGLPFLPAIPAAAATVTTDVTAIASGLVYTDGLIYAPTWGATADVTMSFAFTV